VHVCDVFDHTIMGNAGLLDAPADGSVVSQRSVTFGDDVEVTEDQVQQQAKAPPSPAPQLLVPSPAGKTPQSTADEQSLAGDGAAPQPSASSSADGGSGSTHAVGSQEWYQEQRAADKAMERSGEITPHKPSLSKSNRSTLRILASMRMGAKAEGEVQAEIASGP
jgi:hypothetical protein